jgi:hypothetical protein
MQLKLKLYKLYLEKVKQKDEETRSKIKRAGVSGFNKPKRLSDGS